MTDYKPMDLEEWQRFMAASVRHSINRQHRLYTWTRNPIHAFRAYHLSRALKIDVPGWLFELLDQWAEVLCVNPPKGGKAIADALGLGSKGGPSITSQTKTQARNLEIVEHVFRLREGKPERGTQDIYLEVGEKFHLSSDRVMSIWYELTGETDPDP
jgi:hypothetical protein